MHLISGSSNPALAHSIATHLGIPEIAVEISHFANGEKRIWITEPVKGQNIVLVQSFSQPTDEHIIETLLLADALERMGARHVHLVIPWLGYSFQDKVFRPGEPIAAKVVANLLSHAYIKRVFLLDVHNTSTPGFFSVPSHHLSAQDTFAEYVRTHMGVDQAVIASPDFGGLKRARVFADQLGLDLVNIDKHRDLNTGQVTALGLSGETRGKHVVLIDDAILSGSTATETAKLLKQEGAATVTFLATHGVFVPGALETLESSVISQIVITNSLAHEKLLSRIVQLDIAETFAEELKSWL